MIKNTFFKNWSAKVQKNRQISIILNRLHKQFNKHFTKVHHCIAFCNPYAIFHQGQKGSAMANPACNTKEQGCTTYITFY